MPQVQEVRESKGVTVALAALRKLGGWQRTNAIAKACGPGVNWVLSLLHEAEAVGRVERRHSGTHAFYEWRAVEEIV